jgi:hypothetical protein
MRSHQVRRLFTAGGCKCPTPSDRLAAVLAGAERTFCPVHEAGAIAAAQEQARSEVIDRNIALLQAGRDPDAFLGRLEELEGGGPPDPLVAALAKATRVPVDATPADRRARIAGDGMALNGPGLTAAARSAFSAGTADPTTPIDAPDTKETTTHE